ncbi:hypothetical protein ACQ4PT_030161 [Festuca glaucescens]
MSERSGELVWEAERAAQRCKLGDLEAASASEQEHAREPIGHGRLGGGDQRAAQSQRGHLLAGSGRGRSMSRVTASLDLGRRSDETSAARSARRWLAKAEQPHKRSHLSIFSSRPTHSPPVAMAGLRLVAVAVHLCLLLSPSSALRWLSDPKPESGHGHDSYRTAYHFQPANNWQNDPNGPMYYKGVYHFFYQHNPYRATWGNGNLSWGHSVSVDLINWSALENAMDPDSSFDINGCWSGSATFLADGTPVFLYTGIDASNNQVQNVAFPKNASDPLLREWVKPSYNPVIALPDDVVHDNFRDPSTAWLGRDGLWRVAVSAGFYDGTGSTLVYRSKDFRQWERNAEPLYSSGDAGMVECPDLFPRGGARRPERARLHALERRGRELRAEAERDGHAQRLLRSGAVRRRRRHLLAGGGGQRLPDMAPLRLRPRLRVQVLLRRGQEAARALELGQRVRP